MSRTLVSFILLFMAFGDVNSEDGENKLTSAANCFTLNFYKELAKGESNLVSSPFSVDVLLSMLLVGAGGNTARELSKTLGYEEMSVEDIQEAFQANLHKMKNSDGNTLQIASSIWIQDGFDIEQNFKNAVTEKFYSEQSNVDFRGHAHEAKTKINSWGNEKTSGLIPTLFDSDIDPSTDMLLMNAIYFKGEWQTKFRTQSTQKGNFYNNDYLQDNTSKVQLMNQRGKLLYHDDTALSAEILELDYVGRNMSMIILLPQKGSNISSLENALDCESLKRGISSGNSVLVDVTIPKFEIKSSFNLKKPIEDSGIETIFHEVANFSGISNKKIFVSKAIQKAFIKVYEEGSEAAALTGFGMLRTAMFVARPKVVYFRADHPFLYIIRDKRTGLILFMGKVNELPNAPDL